MPRSLFGTTMNVGTIPEGATFFRTALGGLVVRYNQNEVGCPPKMRVRFSGESLDAPVDEVADMLDEALGNQRWVETGRVDQEVEVDGVTIYRIQEVTFRKPTGGTVTLVFDHPPVPSSGDSGGDSFLEE